MMHADIFRASIQCMTKMHGTHEEKAGFLGSF
jgi:hypothetical protein